MTGHLNLSFIVAIPFLVLFFVLRFKGKITRFKFIVFSTLMLLLQFGVSSEIFATFIFIGAISVFVFFVAYFKNAEYRGKLLRTISEQISAIILTIAILIPYLLLFIKDMPKETFNPSSVYSSDIINFFIPTITNLFLGKKFLRISSQFTGNGSEQGAYLGIFLIIILVGLFVRHIFYKKNDNSKSILILLILFFIIVVLSLGPSLHILQFNKQTTLLPWNIIDRLPLIKNALPVRLSLYTDFIAALLVMIWFYESSRKIPKYVFSILIISSLIPNSKVVYPPAVSVPSFFSSGEYKKVIQRGETVLILPTYFNGGIPAFYQTSTNFYFKIAQEVAGPPPQQLSNNPILWLNNSDVSASQSLDYIQKTGVTKVIVVGIPSKYEKSFLDISDARLIKTENDVSVYDIRKTILQQLVLKNQQLPLSGIDFTAKGNSNNFSPIGFSGLEPWGRWSDEKRASIKFTLLSPIPERAIIRIIFNPLVTYNHTQKYTFYLNGDDIGSELCTINKTTTLDLDVSNKLLSENTFVIDIPNAATPKSLGLNDDERLLGIGMISFRLLKK